MSASTGNRTRVSCVLRVVHVLGSCSIQGDVRVGSDPDVCAIVFCDMAGRYSTTRPWMPAICGYQMRYITSAKYVC